VDLVYALLCVQGDPGGLTRLFSPPYILAPLKSKERGGEMVEDAPDKPSILFFTYCLSHDQRHLLAACTDSRGEMLDTCIININIPNRYA
jgi:mediator of RNA polymerase II transcription subunit 13